MFINIKTSEDGYVSDFKLQAEEGYTEALLLGDLDQFMKYATKYYYNDKTKSLVPPGNAPTITAVEVNDKVEKQSTSIDQLTEGLTALAVSMATKEGE